MDDVDPGIVDDLHRIFADVWNLYFPLGEAVFAPNERHVVAAVHLALFFAGDGGMVLKGDLSAGVAYINMQDLLATCPLTDIAEALRQEPKDILIAMGLACCAVAARRAPRATPHKITVRLSGVEPLTPLRELKANNIDKLVAIHGNVVRVSGIRPLIRSMTFHCAKCEEPSMVQFEDGNYEPPSSCTGNGGKCKSRAFLPHRASAVTVDWQQLRLQEIDEDRAEAARIPRTMECELTEDMVNTCVPGDVVTIVGILKATNLEVAKGKPTDKAKSLYGLYVDVQSITNHKALSSDDARNEAEFSAADLYGIQDIANHPDPFGYLVASMCPGIFGQELVKAALLLALFGGSKRTKNPDVSLRTDCHVIVVGDPGMGKSQLLHAVTRIAPRAVYVCGNTTSTTGLTVTLSKDPVTGDFGLEAGALVLGDQGVCCIDEFDKMGSEHQALLEAMEQQSISIAKAGIVANLSARATVIAAANPTGGHYNRSKTVQENLKMSNALLSRFDLIFILLDKPDQERDKLLSHHVMSLHSSRGASSGIAAAPAAAPTARLTTGRFSQAPTAAGGGGAGITLGTPMSLSGPPVPLQRGEDPRSLHARLQQAIASCKSPLPPMRIRKYIAYARRAVDPLLTQEAAKVLQDFYLTLRRDHLNADATPITTRQLESLIRLSQARAKSELRETVTLQDAIDVVELFKESMLETLTDQYGVVDFTRSTGMSMSKQVKVFVAALHRAAEKNQSAMFTLKDLRDLAETLRLQLESLGAFIEVLNQQNYILKKGPQLYQLQTSMYSQTRTTTRRADDGGIFG